MPKNQKQGPYHHGHLRRALLDAALQLAAERGPDGFTLRQVARRAGVSPAAPYHHFPDKAALVEALAEESFEALATASREAVATTAGRAIDKLQALGVAYIGFALNHPAAFRFIFRPELHHETSTQSLGPDPEPSPIARAAHHAHQVLVDAVRACQREGSLPPGDPAPLALTAWCTVHGLATLLLYGSLGERWTSPDDASHLAKVVTQTLAEGLLVRGDGATKPRPSA